MSAEIIDFMPRHLDMFVPGYWDQEINSWEFREWALRQTGKGFTAVIDGKVMGVIFMTEPVDGVSEAQMYASDELRTRYWLWLGLSFASLFQDCDWAARLGISRFRIRVKEGFWKSRTWVERLGFEAVSQGEGLIVYERAI